MFFVALSFCLDRWVVHVSDGGGLSANCVEQSYTVINLSKTAAETRLTSVCTSHVLPGGQNGRCFVRG